MLVVRRGWLWMVVAGLVVTTGIGAEASPGDVQVVEDPVGQAQWKMDHGEYLGALEILKAQPPAFREKESALRAIGRAYEGLGNWVWARRMWTALLELCPGDCDVRARMAWSHLRESDYREARRVLGLTEEAQKPLCPGTLVERARWDLLLGLAAVQEGLEEAEPYVVRAGQASALFPEDRSLLIRLRQATWPLRQSPMQVALQAEGGWTSNALQGSPTDPAASGEEPASGKMELRAWGRGKWGSAAWGPSLEAEVKTVGYSSELARDFSYVGWAVRPGFEWDFGEVWALAAYRLDSVILSDGDKYERGAYAYFTSHRGELEVEFPFGLTLFGGVGKRQFRQMGRGRTEADGGAGFGVSLANRVSLLAAVAGRYQQAEDPAYNLRGGTGLASLSIGVWQGFSVRLGVTAMFDDYPDSGGSVTFGSDEARNEYAVKGKVALWSPALGQGLQAGLWYEWARRDSSIAAFDYNAHSVALGVSWRFDADPFVPDAEAVPGHRMLDYGFESSDSAMGERLRDLLRKDEDAQRGCSCGN